jgi:hypothetical protein
MPLSSNQSGEAAGSAPSALSGAADPPERVSAALSAFSARTSAAVPKIPVQIKSADRAAQISFLLFMRHPSVSGIFYRIFTFPSRDSFLIRFFLKHF